MRVDTTVPEVGTIFEWDIEEILERPSIDVSFYDPERAARTWEIMLARKRTDSHYADIVESLKRWGFVRPLTSQEEYYGPDFKKTQLQFGDGHHRLAAAIDLGMSTVLIEVHKYQMVASDSGSWRLADSVDNILHVGYRS